MSNIYQLADSFVNYFKQFNTKNIPESFIKEYYILSHQQYISLINIPNLRKLSSFKVLSN